MLMQAEKQSTTTNNKNSIMKWLSLALLFGSSYGFAPSTKLAFQTSLKAASNVNEIVPLRQGSTCALITPFTRTGEVDVGSLKQLLQFHLDSGTDNLCILGTTGEASVLSMEERAIVLNTAVEMCKGKIPLLIGTGTINPKSVKEMTLQAMDIGCDASLVVTPYYVKPPQRALINHFTTAADIGLPVVMYNVPGRSASNFLDENIVLCSQHENIVALKDATGDLKRLDNVLGLLEKENRRNDLLLYSGDDSTTTDFCLKGGDGCISVTANVAAKTMHNMVQAAVAGNTELANKLNEPLVKLHKQIFCESNPIPAKWCAKKVGLIKSAYLRPPLVEMDPIYERGLEGVLREAGLLGYEIKNLGRKNLGTEDEQTSQDEKIVTGVFL
jgi:4-hydroxy-tetrahydrodipicolinate synthase